MSERLSNKEVEDVLSSVRRLVSKQAGPARDRVGAEMNHQAETPVEPEDAPEAEQIADEKLLLTPAFRVEDREAESEVEPAEDPEPPIETMDADDEALSTTPDQSKGSVWSLEERIAELEAAVGGHVDEWEPDGSEDVSAEVPTSFPIPTVEPHDDEDQQDASAPDPAVEVEEHADAAEDVTEDRPAEPVEAEAPAALVEDTAEAEAMPEPPYVDMPGSNIVFAHQAPEAQSNGDAQTTDAAETAEDGAEDATSAIELDDLTEEMLRDLVGDIVRDELQGALGERITRNVRKLVRREIQRALATGRIE